MDIFHLFIGWILKEMDALFPVVILLMILVFLHFINFICVVAKA